MTKLNNKWPHGPTHFELPPVPDGFMTTAGVFYLHVTLDSLIGEEVALLIYDPTDFIYQLADLQPFNFYTGNVAVNTSYGPVFAFLFWVTDPRDNDKIFAAFDKPVDISRPATVEPWKKLRDQTHHHLFLIDADYAVQGFYEFENTHSFDDAVEIISQLDERRVIDFDMAQREYFRDYDLTDLIAMAQAAG